jgi:hypothetical protein
MNAKTTRTWGNYSVANAEMKALVGGAVVRKVMETIWAANVRSRRQLSAVDDKDV